MLFRSRRPSLTPRGNRGFDTGTPVDPNSWGDPLAMAATCRPVLHRPNKLPLVPNYAPLHPSASTIPSLSIRGDSAAQGHTFLGTVPSHGRERSQTPKVHPSERGGGRQEHSFAPKPADLHAEAQSVRQTFKQEHITSEADGFVPNPWYMPQGVV